MGKLGILQVKRVKGRMGRGERMVILSGERVREQKSDKKRRDRKNKNAARKYRIMCLKCQTNLSGAGLSESAE